MPILGPPHPRGAAIRRYASGGRRFGACGWPYKPDSGGFGTPPWGYYGPCARSIARRGGMAGMAAGGATTRRGELAPMASQTGIPPNGSAARSLKIADERSATGRAEGGSILPRRVLAQWKRPDTPAPRGAPLPLILKHPRDSTRAGEDLCAGGAAVMVGLVPAIDVLEPDCRSTRARRGCSPQGRA